MAGKLGAHPGSCPEQARRSRKLSRQPEAEAAGVLPVSPFLRERPDSKERDREERQQGGEEEGRREVGEERINTGE